MREESLHYKGGQDKLGNTLAFQQHQLQNAAHVQQSRPKQRTFSRILDTGKKIWTVITLKNAHRL